MCSGEKATVLLVDDEAALLRALQRELRGLPVTLQVAQSGEEALAWLRAGGAPAAVITDQRMGGMTGLELLAEVEQLVPTALRVLHTGEGLLEVELRPGSLLAILGKPADPATLRRLVSAVIRSAADTP